MLKKTCPQCQSSSYSSTTRGPAWLCPKCGKDLTDVPTEAPLPPRSKGSKQNAKTNGLKAIMQEIIKKITD